MLFLYFCEIWKCNSFLCLNFINFAVCIPLIIQRSVLYMIYFPRSKFCFLFVLCILLYKMLTHNILRDDGQYNISYLLQNQLRIFWKSGGINFFLFFNFSKQEFLVGFGFGRWICLWVFFVCYLGLGFFVYLFWLVVLVFWGVLCVFIFFPLEFGWGFLQEWCCGFFWRGVVVFFLFFCNPCM